MEESNLNYPIAFKGYDMEFIDEIISEKDRLIEIQEKDVGSLKREIVDLKKKLNYLERKKKR